MKPFLDNLLVLPFSDLKELMAPNRYKTKTKPHITQESSKKVFVLNVKFFWNEWLLRYQPNVYGFSIGPDLYKKTT